MAANKFVLSIFDAVSKGLQKTNGFNRKAEKNTSSSLAEKKSGIFRAVKKWNTCCVFGISS